MKAFVPLLAAALLAGPTAPSQAQGAPALPRAADGHADLTGTWTNAALTQLTRPAGSPLVVSEAIARAAAARVAAADAADSRPTDPNAPPPAEIAAIGIGFNAFWRDSGDSYARVKGEFRSSWIVSPADGQLPLTEAGRKLARAAAVTRNRQDPDGPEQLAPNDRCIIGSRGSGGPGMLNNVYNSNYQIVQTRDAVVIVVEMAHDARTIPLFASKAAAQAGHGPAALQRWLGDSTAWWEGDDLVIETVNVNPQQGVFGPIHLSAGGRVTERLTRASDKQIFYTFEVEDPANYTQPWRAEMSLNAIPGPIYEYACHEGNYAMRGILAAARGPSGGARADAP